MMNCVTVILISLAISNSGVTCNRDSNTVSRIISDGYPIEEHELITPDGYILTMHRIPFSPKNLTNNNSIKPPVYLQHGFTTSSSDWVIGGPDKALAYLLSDAGYDVWLGNNRGNTYSNNHTNLDPKSKTYWNFSWHEIALYDISTMIDHILTKTNTSSLHYVGHSQGTTVFFVLMSMKPEYNLKIKSMHAYAPIAYMSNSKSLLLRTLAPLVGDSSSLIEYIGSTSLSPSFKLLTKLGYYICKQESIVQELCANALFLVCGYNSENLNRTIVPDILANIPAGASINQVVHYVQLFNSQKFRMFDYGFLRNLWKYKRTSPPNYNLKKITSPVYLYYGENDLLSSVDDVQILASELGNLQLNLKYAKWNHLDFLWGNQAKEYLFNFTIENMKKLE